MISEREFDGAADTVRQKKTGSRKTYDGCPCGSITFEGGHFADPRDGRIFNRCKECGGLVRSHYIEHKIGDTKLFTRD